MRSGRAAATSSASTFSAPWPARPRRSKPISPRSARPEARAPRSTPMSRALKDDMRDLADFETRARDLCDRMATGLQAAALIRAGSPVADAFCRSRLESRGAHHYGALTGIDARAIVKRAAAR